MDVTQIIYNSRSNRFKEPCGAVEEGTTVKLRLMVSKNIVTSGGRLVVQNDVSGTVEHIPMNLHESQYDPERYVCYEASFSAAEKGLYWYYFELDTDYGLAKVGCSGMDNRAIFCDAPRSWQQTVYAKTYETPEWIYGGIYYQIFVDRFHHVGEQVHMDGKWTRDDWGGMPVYQPVDGRIYNNDFFGGNLRGIIEKLPYLETLGVTCLYLSPIVEAYSNHKYDTADYRKVDPMFGTMEDFEELCQKAKEKGMRVICDGVFSHTGSDSIYFNKYRHYGDGGAYNDPNGEYSDWYFIYPDGTYETWWGIDTLPRLNKHSESYRKFMNGDGGVVQHWLRHGASGWRLDVADELPAAFLSELTAAAKKAKSDALIVGEVWEDASNKSAYDERKNYFRGDRLDSVMNYPLKDAIIRCVRYGDAYGLVYTVEQQWENYPHFIVHAMMNHLGTHDSVRLLTALAGEEVPFDAPRDLQVSLSLDGWGWKTGIRRLKMAVALQMTLPGVPCIYYGDEAGMEGYKDPFNRKCYPWGSENEEILSWYRLITKIRRDHKVFEKGDYSTVAISGGMLAFARYDENERIIIVVNCGKSGEELILPGEWKELISGRTVVGNTTVLPEEIMILKK